MHEWRAAHVPTVPVTASLDGCRELTDGTSADTTVYRCQYHWSFQGHPRQEERDAKKLYTDGHTLRVVMDPATGSLVDTGLSRFVQSTVVAGFITCGSLCVLSLALGAGRSRLSRRTPARRTAMPRRKITACGDGQGIARMHGRGSCRPAVGRAPHLFLSTVRSAYGRRT